MKARTILAAPCLLGMMAIAFAQSSDAPGPPRLESRYTFTWPVGPTAPAPRGGTTRGVGIKLDTSVSPQWKGLREEGIPAAERDRRAILAMAGSYRVSFDFLEVAAFTGDGSRAQPYQSWGTERVFVDRDEPRRVSLVHILEMHMVGADGKPMEPMVTKHWRQEWRYEPPYVIEYRGANRWVRRDLSRGERQGRWSQVVYQVDEAPRYGALGKWEHNGSFSTWVSDEALRPLPRREWTVRKDYDLLRGTNRHTITPTGWLQEENNLKVVSGTVEAYVGREYGVARYERVAGEYFSEASKYYESTRKYWSEVVAAWDEIWEGNRVVTLKASSDQSGAYVDLFQLADDYAAGKLDIASAKEKIRTSLLQQQAALPTAKVVR